MDDDNKAQTDREKALQHRQEIEAYYIELDRQKQESKRQAQELAEELKRQQDEIYRTNPEAVAERLEKLKEAKDFINWLFLIMLFGPFILAVNIISISLNIPDFEPAEVQTRQAVLCYAPAGPKRSSGYWLEALFLRIDLEPSPYIPFNQVPDSQRPYLSNYLTSSKMVNVFDGEFLSRGGRKDVFNCVHLDDVGIKVSYIQRGLLAENVPINLWFGNKKILNPDHMSELYSSSKRSFYCITLIFGFGLNLFIYLMIRPTYLEVKRMKAFQRSFE